MYEVQIINRGPEGVRGHQTFRTTEAGSDELHNRMLAGVATGELLDGIQRKELPDIHDITPGPLPNLKDDDQVEMVSKPKADE